MAIFSFQIQDDFQTGKKPRDLLIPEKKHHRNFSWLKTIPSKMHEAA
jgi:hypothetical protein